MSENPPISFEQERERRIKRIKDAIEFRVDAAGGGMYHVEWLNQEQQSLRSFSFRLDLIDDSGYASAEGHFSFGAVILEIPELADYQFDETSVNEEPPCIRFTKNLPAAAND